MEAKHKKTIRLLKALLVFMFVLYLSDSLATWQAIRNANKLIRAQTGACSYEVLLKQAPETLVAPSISLFIDRNGAYTQLEEENALEAQLKASELYFNNGTWATLADGTECKLF